MTDPRQMNLTRADKVRSAADGATVGLACAAAIVLAAMLIAKPAPAATITEGRHAGAPRALDIADFFALSPATPGGSVTTAGGVPVDGSTPILKCPSDSVPDGRRNAGEPGECWIENADLAVWEWRTAFDAPVASFGLGFTDWADQGKPATVLFGDASFTFDPVAETEFPVARWLTFTPDAPTTTVRVIFDGAPRDGVSVSGLTVAPIPLPATALLLLGGLAGLAMVRRARG